MAGAVPDKNRKRAGAGERGQSHHLIVAREWRKCGRVVWYLSNAVIYR